MNETAGPGRGPGGPVVSGAEREWLAEAVRRACDNVADDGGPFGALVVRGGTVVATGVNRVTADLDPTAHAEVAAIRTACRQLGSFSLAGCVLLASCEPCPMCMAAAMWARLDRVVYAADRVEAAQAGFDDLAFYDMFNHPRSQWPMEVLQVALHERVAPFTAWAAHPVRTEY